VVVLRHDEVVEHDVPCFLREHSVFQVFVDSEVGKKGLLRRVVGPGVVRVGIVPHRVAGVEPRCKNEDPQPEADVGMGSIVGDIAQSIPHGAHVQGGRGAIRVLFDFIPDAVEVAAGSYVIDEIVGGVGDPEGSDGCVGLQHPSGGQ
jgi:hypothetical protein